MELDELAFFVDGVDETADFYESLLGRAPVHHGDGVAIFECDGVEFLVHETYEPGPDDLPCEDHVAFRVDDLDRTCDALRERGLEILRPPQTYDWGRSAYLRTPDGQLVELSEAD